MDGASTSPNGSTSEICAIAVLYERVRQAASSRASLKSRFVGSVLTASARSRSASAGLPVDTRRRLSERAASVRAATFTGAGVGFGAAEAALAGAVGFGADAAVF